MTELQSDIWIDATPEQVFDTCSDLPNASEMIRGIKSIEILSEGPIGEGTRWRETRVMLGREATEEMWFSEFVRPERYVVEADSHGTKYLTDFTFVPEQKGTRVHLRFQAHPRTMFAKMMSPLAKMMTKTLQKCLTDDLEDVKQACERTGGASS